VDGFASLAMKDSAALDAFRRQVTAHADMRGHDSGAHLHTLAGFGFSGSIPYFAIASLTRRAGSN
jgi:hypothetical protein